MLDLILMDYDLYRITGDVRYLHRAVELADWYFNFNFNFNYVG